MQMSSFESKHIIITGAGSGIGKALLRQLYPLTKNILAVDNSDLYLRELKTEFPDLEGIINSDLSKKNGNESILKWVEEHWSSVEYCFANAGKAEFNAAEVQNWKEMESLFQLNVFSPIQLGLELKSTLRNSGLRHVITCSAMAFWAIPGYSLYGSSKAALLQWARTVWAEKSGDWLTLVFPIATSTGFFSTAGKNIPKAFPVQSPELVAEKILSGVARGKKKIFPALIFRWMLHLNNFLYLIRPMYQAVELRKFRSWINT